MAGGGQATGGAVKVWLFPWRVRNDDHSMSIAFGLTRPPRVLMIGWGWDRDLPL